MEMCKIFSSKKHVLKVFSETAHELVVIRKPPNAHPRPYLMQKEPTDLLNLPRRGTISGVQNLTLCCKIDTVLIVPICIENGSLSKGSP